MDKYVINSHDVRIGERVRAILGVPQEILTDDIISSSIFKEQAENYINKGINEYLELIDESNTGLLDIAAMYYISYLLCTGMDARLPKQMENLSTKTVLNSINWDEKALEMLAKADEVLDDFLEDYTDDNGYNSFAELSDEMEYPETNI